MFYGQDTKDEEVVNGYEPLAAPRPLPPVFLAVGGPLFVLVWCDGTMPACVTGQPPTKAFIDVSARVALGAGLPHKPPDGRKKALTPLRSHCLSSLPISCQVNM